MAKDYYKILGVDKDSSTVDIKKAYKTLAKKYHPDLNKESGSSDKFKEINEAASVLTDEKKRAQYDRFGTAGSNFGQGFGYQDFSSNDFGFDLGDIFEGLFGGRGRKKRSSRVMRGSDIEVEVMIELEDAATGVKKTVNVPRLETCNNCNGLGAESESGISSCGVCNGAGTVRRDMRTPLGVFSQSSTCTACRGEGKVIKTPCSGCGGNGRIRKTRKIEINIPEGVSSGSRLRMAGEGEAGIHNGPNGDLYVFIDIKEHKIFTRKNDDIYMELPVSFAQACLGASIEVPTLKGLASLKIPAHTQSNTVFRMKSYGIPSLQGYGTGSQHVKVIIDVPQKLNKKQQNLLKEFDSSLDKKKSFFDGMFS